MWRIAIFVILFVICQISYGMYPMGGHDEDSGFDGDSGGEEYGFPQPGGQWKKVNNELVIPYVISYDKSSWQYKRILERIAEINGFFKCNKNVWRPRKNETGFVNFRSHDGLCSSAVGKVKKDREQFINLHDQCIRKSGLLHEMCHAMGFNHELDRPDRYKTLKINWQNVDPKNRMKMAPKPVDPMFNHGKIDFESIMMAGQYAKSKKGSKRLGKKTLIALDPAEQHKLDKKGGREGLSDTDKEVLNKYYGCIKFKKEKPTFVTKGDCKEYDWCADAIKNQPELCTYKRKKRAWKRACPISCKHCK